MYSRAKPCTVPEFFQFVQSGVKIVQIVLREDTLNRSSSCIAFWIFYLAINMFDLSESDEEIL